MTKKYEKFTLRNVSYETRAEDGGKKYVRGIIPYNSQSEDLGGYKEVISNTAFNKTLSDKSEVRALFNHDTSKILGSTKSGTLILESTSEGLVCDVLLPNTTYANDLYEIMSRGDCNTMSFGFYDIKHEDKGQLRTLKEVKLQEVSMGVIFPAYAETNSQAYLRTFLRRTNMALDMEAINNLFEKYNTDPTSLSDEDKTLLKDFVKTISAIYEPTPAPEDDAKAAEAAKAEADALETLKKEADALELENEISTI